MSDIHSKPWYYSVDMKMYCWKHVLFIPILLLAGYGNTWAFVTTTKHTFLMRPRIFITWKRAHFSHGRIFWWYLCIGKVLVCIRYYVESLLPTLVTCIVVKLLVQQMKCWVMGRARFNGCACRQDQSHFPLLLFDKKKLKWES